MGRSKKQAYISVPSDIISSLSSSSLQSLVTPKKSFPPPACGFSKRASKLCGLVKRPKFWFLCLFLFGFLGMSKLFLKLDPLSPIFPHHVRLSPFATAGYYITTRRNQQKLISSEAHLEESKSKIVQDDEIEFWKQPDGMGYKPRLDFSADSEYRKSARENKQDMIKFSIVVVSGGMNQQRNQIVDVAF